MIRILAEGETPWDKKIGWEAAGTYTNQSYHTEHDKSSLKGDRKGGFRPCFRSRLIVCTKMGATHVLWLACVHCDTQHSTCRTIHDFHLEHLK